VALSAAGFSSPVPPHFPVATRAPVTQRAARGKLTHDFVYEVDGKLTSADIIEGIRKQ